MTDLRPVPDELVTRDELAALMCVSVKTVDRLVKDGMPTVSWGRRLTRFRVSEALAWAANQDRKAA